MEQCFSPARLGGLEQIDYLAARHAIYAATSYATWPTTSALVPALSADLSADPSNLSVPAAAFASAYRHCVDAHATVVAAYNAQDSKRHFLVTGGSRTHHRPRHYVVSRCFPLLSDLYADRSAGKIIHPSQKALMEAVQHGAYLDWWRRVSAFDANNTGATIRDREARRLVSVSQPVADRWVTASPDATVPHSRPRSAVSRTMTERRIGLYLTTAAPYYDALEATGKAVSQSDRLGDSALNSSSKTGRHNRFNRTCRDAIAAKATTSVILGDKGDGSPRSRAAALQRYAWANDGHVTDIIEKHAAHNGNHICYESKCYTPLKIKASDNLGNGTQSGGGSPSTAHGHLVAFGCTEESLLREIRGCKARGSPTERAFAHDTGLGYVAARKGYYDDAIANKGNTVVALISEEFGGVVPVVTALLRRLEKKAVADGTRYGANSTRNFVSHHATAMSFAIVTGVATAIVDGVSKLETRMAGAAPSDAMHGA